MHRGCYNLKEKYYWAPLQKAGLLSYEVLNSGQLKKYLNADW